MRQMSEVEKAYIAGLMDGEGCIAIVKNSPKGRAISVSYRVTIVMNMTDAGQMDYCQRITGAGYITRHEVNTRPNCRDRWQWSLYKDETIELLREIYPYLILKKPQAALALEFVDKLTKVKRLANRIDVELQKKKEEYFIAIKQLKYLTGEVIDWPEEITLEVVNKVFEDRSLLHRCFIDKENENVN
jgi:hypothetical protein